MNSKHIKIRFNWLINSTKQIKQIELNIHLIQKSSTNPKIRIRINRVLTQLLTI